MKYEDLEAAIHAEHAGSPIEPSRPNGKLKTKSAPKIRSIADVPLLHDCETTPITYLEEPVLVAGAVTALTGDAGCGKSTLLCAMARRIHAAGLPSSPGRRAPTRPVLILDRENPKAVVEDRFRRLGMTDDETFRVWGGWTGQEAPQPASAIVLGWVAECKPSPLVIVDSMSAFHGGDENSASETRAFLHQLRRLADLGAAVAVQHHDGKAESAKDYRGSSDFKAAVDCAFHVSNFSEDGKLGKLVLRCYKSRFGFAGEVVYEYASGKLLRAEQATATQTVTEQLTALLRTNPGVGARDFDQLAANRGLGRNRARGWLNDGVLSGAIQMARGRNNGRRYFLSGDHHAG
jgi:hypothetical protein